METHKILLMGSSGAGKSSIRCVLFANTLPKDTAKIGFTQYITQKRASSFGGREMEIWDCPGQNNFMKHYFESQREFLFKNCQILVYVFDMSSAIDINDIKFCVDAVAELSPNARIFGLMHKSDIVPATERDKIYWEKVREVQREGIEFFMTSIWNESLYSTWSEIIQWLVPNSDGLRSTLLGLCDAWEADEVVLFDKLTFLVISSHSNKLFKDKYRFEKISSIIKMFKITCSKASAGFVSMNVTSSRYSAIIDEFNSNSYILVVTSKPHVLPALSKMNVQLAKPLLSNICF